MKFYRKIKNLNWGHVHFRNENLLPLAALTGIWILAIALVNPAGNFPLNDDFAFARMVLNMLGQGRLVFDSWPAMTLLTHVLWGAGFCKLSGFSFVVLRFSTLVLAWVGLVAVFFLGRELGQGRMLSALVAAIVMFSPFYFLLSFSFMTDVPFFTWCVLSTLFYGKALRTGLLLPVLAGTSFALVATFSRQLGLMLPLSFGVAWLLREKLSLRACLTALAPAILTAALLLCYTRWLAATQEPMENFGSPDKLLKRVGSPNFWAVSFERIGILMAYLGAFLLPLSLALLPSLRHLFSLLKKWWFLLALSLLLCTFTAAWSRLPWGNLLYNFGLGPKLLKDGYFFLNLKPVLPIWGVNLLKITGFSAALLFLFLKNANPPRPFLQNLRHQPFVVFACVNLALYLGFLLLDIYFFDRYFFQMLPFLLVVVLSGRRFFLKKNRLQLALAALALLAIFSISATHDYLAWNRTRWLALDFLQKEKNVSPSRIDGGFEFNGWHKPGELDYHSAKSWWWVDRDDYAVTFGQLDGFSKEKGFPYLRWLPPGTDSIYILKRN